MHLTDRYELRFTPEQRKQWKRAAFVKEAKDLAAWIRDTLDAGAKRDLSNNTND